MLHKFHIYDSADSNSLCLLKQTLLIQFTPSFESVNLVLYIVAVIFFIIYKNQRRDFVAQFNKLRPVNKVKSIQDAGELR